MAKVVVDTQQKLIEVDLSGFVTVQQATRVSEDLKRGLAQFAPQEGLLLIDLLGFAPMTSDVVAMIRGMGRDVISSFRKTALIQDFPAKFQGRLLIEASAGTRLPAFPTREAAIQYLLEPAE
jgi:hypothetical protein